MESTSSDKNVHSVKSDPKFVSDGSAITSHGVLSSSSTLVDTRSLISGSRPANVPLVVSGQGSNPALASNGQPQAIILNHFGQPLGIGSQQTVFAVPFTPTSQPPSSESIGGASGAGSSKPLAQQPPSTPIHQPPLVMAYRAPSVQHPVASQLSNFNVSNTTHQLPLFPNVGSNATSALAAVSAFNAPILLPTGQMVFRTPHGQLIGFQVPALNRNGICTDPSTAAAAGVTASHFSAKFPLPKTYSNSVPLASHSAQHSTTLNHGVSKHSVSSGKSHAHADPRDTAEAKAVAAAIVAATAAKAATISSTKVSSTKDVKSDSAAPEKTVDKMSKQRSCDASSVVPEAVLNGTMGVETTELEKRTQPQPSRPVTPPRGSPLSPFLSPKELIDEGSQKFTVTVDSDIHAMFLQQLEEYAKSAKPQVQEVQMWLSSLGPGVAQYCNTFQQQEIDGQALLLLHEDHLVRTMGLKLGPAVKVCAALKILRG
ncbi:unnamed protein product [Soboliphyme baturini]|uniref:SAM domain-containing protein n=1 Tax=Soboliphyme baturini TaxID=241478 RepID=A0A183IAX3_9BILA|nr:unnamed protein product [Soboliphyme baturini]